PLCFEPFTKISLNSDSTNQLTLEDVPPKSLGGNPKVLTCKNCNSFSGSELDVHILNHLLSLDAKALNNVTFNTSFESGGAKVNGTISTNNEGKLTLNVEAKRSNPKEIEMIKKWINHSLFKYELFSPLNGWNTEGGSVKAKFSLPNNYIKRRSEIAALRIGYLYAFSILGYSFLLNSHLYKVREQILNPDKEILPKQFWINYEFPKEAEGVNIISSPNEL
ncbi:MAG: hypothetical protein WBA74_20850, partial [Cyclobacteriaceae bacterium]